MYNLMNGGVRRQEYGAPVSMGTGGYTPPSLFPQTAASQTEQLHVSPMKPSSVFHPQPRVPESTVYTPPAVVSEEKGLFERLSKPKSEVKSTPNSVFASKQQDLLSLDTVSPQQGGTGLDLISFDSAPQSQDLLIVEPPAPTVAYTAPILPSAPTPPVRIPPVTCMSASPVKISHNMAPPPASTSPVQHPAPTVKGGLDFEAVTTGLDDLKLEVKPKDSRKSEFVIRI